MSRESSLIAKSESGFQTFFLSIPDWEINPHKNAHRTQWRYFKKIGEMESAQKFLRTRTWLQHTPIHNRQLFEKIEKVRNWVFGLLELST